jgi:uncharacterized protein (TIGR03118 family)
MLTWCRTLWRVFRGRTAVRPRPTHRPALEPLEARALLSARFLQTNLVADRPNRAAFTDPHLVNPWGITASPTGPFWVSDNGTGVSTVYDGSGMPFPSVMPLVVTIPAPPGETGPSAPTGIVFNGNSSEFIVSSGAVSGHALFLFSTEDGTIAGWNPAVDPTHAVIAVPKSPTAIYKGLALSSGPGPHFLFATNFHDGTVDEFDSSFHLVRTFTDPRAQRHHFAPFGIASINGQVYVTFAKQDRHREDDVAGPGLGFVDVFDTSGNFVKRLVTRGKLNAPWGLAVAPSGFSKFGGDLLVGNFGDGTIHAYDPVTGQFRGTFFRRRGHPLSIDGLWGLTFGNNGVAGSSNTLFFTAGPKDEKHGLFGSLTPR